MPLVERRYAEALVAIAEQNGLIDEYQQEFQAVVDAFHHQMEFKFFLFNPEIKIDVKKEVIRKIFTGRVKNELINFLELLLDKGRIKFLPGILQEYVKMADQKKNILSITIVTAATLDGAKVEEIKEKYKKLYHASHVKAQVEMDPKLIGGLKVKIGDKVIDGTIMGRIESMKEILLR